MKTWPTDSFVFLGHPRHFAQWNILILSRMPLERFNLANGFIRPRSSAAFCSMEYTDPFENAAREILVVRTSSSEPSGRRRRARGVASNEGAKDDLLDWMQQGELLYKNSVLYIPQVEALRMSVLRNHRNDPLAGHLAIKKTYNLIKRKCFWPDIEKG